MEKMNQIQEELRQIGPSIANIEKLNVYSVSRVYFENLAGDILEKISSGVEPVYFLPNVMPYQVPDGYFENLAEEILGKVEAKKDDKNEVFEEMEKIFPLLNTINKKPVFTVPPSYFEGLRTPRSEVLRREARVVKIPGQKFIRYLVAAAITSILAVAGFFFTNKDAGTSPVVDNSTHVEIKNLSEHEIVEFLKKNASPFDASSTWGRAYDRENDIEGAVKEMSDKEIQQFLQDNAVSDEI